MSKQKLTSSDGAEMDGFGDRVALHDDTAVVGAPNNDRSRGAVFVYDKPKKRLGHDD